MLPHVLLIISSAGIAGLLGVLLSRRRGLFPHPGPAAPWSRADRWQAWGLGICALGLAVGVAGLVVTPGRSTDTSAAPSGGSTGSTSSAPQTSTSPPTPGPRAEILTPPNGATVPSELVFRGTASGLGDRELWIIGIPPDSTSYFPRSGPVVVDATGHWEARISVRTGRGAQHDVRRTFRFRTVVIDGAARERFARCRDRACPVAIPQDAVLGPSVAVMRTGLD